MSKRELIAKNRDAILALAAKHGATDVRLFGSVARGEDAAASDIDVLARFRDETGWSVFARPLELEEALAKLLGCKVHVLREYPTMRPRLRAELERDLIPL
jgi:hypothetical protein